MHHQSRCRQGSAVTVSAHLNFARREGEGGAGNYDKTAGEFHKSRLIANKFKDV